MPNAKILSLAEMVDKVTHLKNQNQKVVLAHGTFDSLHYGYVFYLREAKKQGDTLVVSVIADKYVRKGMIGSIANQRVRSELLAELSCVDYIVICEDYGPWEVMKALVPDVYAKGEDTAGQLDDPDSGVSLDKQTIESLGGKFVLTKSMIVHQTGGLNSYFRVLPEETIVFLNAFRNKHNVADIIGQIDRLHALKVLFIGESIIDEYTFIAPLGKPNKSNVIAGQFMHAEKYAGGILACANHAASICDDIAVTTYLGENNSHLQFVSEHLHPGIKRDFFLCPQQSTIVKTRYLDTNSLSKYLEVYAYDKRYLPLEVEDMVFEHLDRDLLNFDLVVVADYGHGFLSPRLIQLISSKSKFLAVNTQTNSGNAGFNCITKYPAADFVALDEMEARLALQDDVSDIKDIIGKISKLLGAKLTVITLGAKGLIYHDSRLGSVNEMPSFTIGAVDSIGAGDAFLSIGAVCAARGLSPDLTVFLGQVASSIAVKIIGNKKPVTKEALFQGVNCLME